MAFPERTGLVGLMELKTKAMGMRNDVEKITS